MISSLELARLCGVSQGTVDRALHGRPGVSARTRERIEAAAREHGYRPHPAAREILSGKSQVLGAIMPMGGAVFFLDLIQELKRAADSHGLRLCITPIGTAREFLAALEDFAARRARGVIAVPPGEALEIPASLAAALPIASLLSPVANASVPLFAPDEFATGSLATQYLLDQGHRNIAHLTYPRPAFAIDGRRDGYAAAMEARELPAQVFTSPGSLPEAAHDHGFTAVFCHNDWLALAAIRALESAGLRVPADVSVLGVDDSPTFNQFQDDITTFRYPAAEVSTAAVNWLLTGEPQPAIPLPLLVPKDSVRPIGVTKSRTRRNEPPNKPSSRSLP